MLKPKFTVASVIRGESRDSLFPKVPVLYIAPIPCPITKSWLWDEYCKVKPADRHPRKYPVAEQLEVDYMFLKRVEEKCPELLAPLVDSYRKTCSWNVVGAVREKLLERGLL